MADHSPLFIQKAVSKKLTNDPLFRAQIGVATRPDNMIVVQAKDPRLATNIVKGFAGVKTVVTQEVSGPDLAGGLFGQFLVAREGDNFYMLDRLDLENDKPALCDVMRKMSAPPRAATQG